MSVPLSIRFGARGATLWGITWGVGIAIVDYFTVAPIDDWGSMRQLAFWLFYWMTPWCLAGRIFVWLADHHARIGSRWRLMAAFVALCGLSAALNPLLSIALIRLMTHAFPQFEHYATDLRSMPAPSLVNWSSFVVYQLWECAFYFGLLVTARIFTVRVERSGHLLHQSATGRSRTEGLLDEARLQALQLQIDPNLLLDSMKELEQRYRASPERAERLLEVLVEFLRYAMHGLRVPVSTLEAELQLARAFSHLQHERGLKGVWRIVEEPRPPGAPLEFPSLLMLRLLALGGEGGQPFARPRGARTDGSVAAGICVERLGRAGSANTYPPAGAVRRTFPCGESFARPASTEHHATAGLAGRFG